MDPANQRAASRLNGDETTLLLTGAIAHPFEMMQREGPMATLLDFVVPEEGTSHATVRSGDGLFRASIPLEWLRAGRIVGGRLLIPDAPTKCWSVKDVVEIRFTRGPVEDSVRPETFIDRDQI